MFGFFNLRKPAGPTSHDMVSAVRRLLPRGTRVGHAGTLDPFADGVLVICVGPAARLAEFVQAAPKRYRAVVTLGATSTTDDPEGEILLREPREPAPHPPSPQAVRQAVARFVGEIPQVPPAHSAVLVNGRRAYKLARAGRELNLRPRVVAIHAIDVIGYDWPRLTLDVSCGSGTYLRALARDLGEALGAGGYCSALTRTAVGRFTLEDSVAPEALDPARDLLSPLPAVDHMTRFTASDDDVRQLRLGQRLAAPDDLPDGAELAVLDPAGQLVALAVVRPGRRLQPVKVFL